jgi:hypothetical protein
MARLAVVVLSIALIGSASPHPLLAECIAPGSVCEEFQRATRVFLGEVTALDWDPLDNVGPMPPTFQATFRILESFKGTTGPEVMMRFTSGSEQPLYTKGYRSLIYAVRSTLRPDAWWAGCSRNRSAGPDDPEVLALRNLARGAAGAIVEGSIERPAAGTRVTATSIDATVTSTLLPGGRFVLWLAPGSYRVGAGDDTARAQPVVVGPGVRCIKGPVLPGLTGSAVRSR